MFCRDILKSIRGKSVKNEKRHNSEMTEWNQIMKYIS